MGASPLPAEASYRSFPAYCPFPQSCIPQPRTCAPYAPDLSMSCKQSNCRYRMGCGRGMCVRWFWPAHQGRKLDVRFVCWPKSEGAPRKIGPFHSPLHTSSAPLVSPSPRNATITKEHTLQLLCLAR